MSKKPHRLRPPRNDLVDAVVLEVYGLVHDQGWLADRALERATRRERGLWANERRAAAEAVYGLLRAGLQLDWLLGGAPDLQTRYAAWLVRGGGLSAADASRRLGVPPRALAALEGADARIAAIRDPLERLAIEGGLPRWIAERFVAELGEAEARLLVRAMNARAPLTVRANLLKVERDALRARLVAEGVESEPTRFSPWGLVLDGHLNAFALPAFKDGLFEIQDEGSQLIALACAARPQKVVVDACAGAGGKALALAAEMRNRGSLHALDSDEDRLEEARRRGRRDGVDNLRTRPIPAGPEATEALADLAGTADVVLVDAPCSGLGTLRRKPDVRVRLKPEDPARFAAIQRELLGRFAPLAKPGGRVIYATCAIGRIENDDVADFAERELGLVPAPLEAALGAERTKALGIVGHRAAIFPHRHGTDGFFFAAYTRRK